MATKSNKLDAMRTLIDLGADINAQIVTVGHSPMHYACMYGLQGASMMLLEAGGEKLRGRSPARSGSTRLRRID